MYDVAVRVPRRAWALLERAAGLGLFAPEFARDKAIEDSGDDEKQEGGGCGVPTKLADFHHSLPKVLSTEVCLITRTQLFGNICCFSAN